MAEQRDKVEVAVARIGALVARHCDLDARFEISGDIPFDPSRLILGCFRPLYTMGRA